MRVRLVPASQCALATSTCMPQPGIQQTKAAGQLSTEQHKDSAPPLWDTPTKSPAKRATHFHSSLVMALLLYGFSRHSCTNSFTCALVAESAWAGGCGQT